MRTEILGDGEPEIAVIYQLHGDEEAGRKAVERLKSMDIDLKKSLELIQANPAASERSERFVDKDLNRSFPGDPLSQNYEERLAYQLSRRLNGKKVLDLHTSESKPVPFGIIVKRRLRDADITKSLEAGRIADFSNFSEARISGAERIAVECGNPGTEEAVENAVNAIKRFLSLNDAIRTDLQEKKDPEIFNVYDKATGKGYRFTAENFQKVEEGEVYAVKDGEEKVAKEDFYPVLMSTDGYEDIIGFKAKKDE